MKITRRQLRQIINETLSLNEAAPLIPVAAAPVAASAGFVPVAGATAASMAGPVGLLAAALAGAIWWLTMDDDKKERIMAIVNEENLHAAMAIYSALKGAGTDEDTVNAGLNSEAIPKIYADYARVLQIMDEDTNQDLEQWLRDDGMEEAANMVQNTIELALKTYRGTVSRA